jgi:hypothetical protein
VFSVDPKPWTPSTHSKARSFSSRSAFNRVTAAAMCAMGMRTPLPECTHVNAITRVRGVTAADTAPTISSSEAVSERV